MFFKSDRAYPELRRMRWLVIAVLAASVGVPVVAGTLLRVFG